ncbi:MAG: YdcF family protein [Hyphomicrobium sp.]
MRRLFRPLVFLAALSAGVFAFGFVLFATAVTRDPIGGWDKADGIVVLTGGDSRIVAGAKLLADGRAKRLLISGVNRQVRREDVARISGLDRAKFACCVDLGYEALDTFGNADEARSWARANGYSRLIIVTSSYHMPRSLAELALAMPDVELFAHAVTPPSFPESGWWLHVRTTRVLLSEYLKYLPAAARLATQRMMGWSEDQSVAVAQPKPDDG